MKKLHFKLDYPFTALISFKLFSQISQVLSILQILALSLEKGISTIRPGRKIFKLYLLTTVPEDILNCGNPYLYQFCDIIFLTIIPSPHIDISHAVIRLKIS
jgi:hypothetical protein